MNLKRKYLIMAVVLALAVSIAAMPLYSTAAKTSRRGINEETTTYFLQVNLQRKSGSISRTTASNIAIHCHPNC